MASESGRRNVLLGVGVAVVVVLLALYLAPVCPAVLLRHGVWLQECPDGAIVPTLELSFDPASATLTSRTFVRFVPRGRDAPEQLALAGLQPALAWVHGRGTVTDAGALAFAPKGDAVEVRLPSVEARFLRATVQTPFGPATAELPAPSPPSDVTLTLAAARHEPGGTLEATVQLRGAGGLPPRAGVEGRFVLLDPAGAPIVEEPSVTDGQGRASLSLPLDPLTPPGLLRLRWEAGLARAERDVAIGRELPATEAKAAAVTLTAASPFHPDRVRADRLVAVLAELHDAVDAWRLEGAADEPLTEATIARLFAEVLAARTARREPTTDAFGRPLQIQRLPPSLQALFSPRALQGATGRALLAVQEAP